MKILVCKNKHCRNKQTEDTYKELMNYVEDIEFMHSSCMDLCDYGPNVLTFPEGAFYQAVTKDRVDDLIHHKAEDLRHPSQRLHDESMELYYSDPMHRRTVKLFRWHLDKLGDFEWRTIRESISIFKDKYDVRGMALTFPVKMALIGTTKGPDLPKMLQFMGKELAFKRIDQYLSDNKYRI